MTAIMIDGTKRNAIFAATDGGRPVVVSEGGRIGPFTVQSIEPQQVTIIGPEGKRAVRTSFDPHPPAVMAPVPPLSPIAPQPGLSAAGHAAGAGGAMRRACLLLLAVLAGCEHPEAPVVQALPAVRNTVSGTASPRVSGPIGSTNIGWARPRSRSARCARSPMPTADQGSGAGDISLDFVDTDIREVAAQVLGNILRVNYTIDPAVRGTATLRTVNPIARSRVLPVLQSMLAQNGATVIQSGDVYRVVPAAAAVTGAGIAGGVALAGSAIVPLQYASADDLAKVMQPYAGTTGRVVADPGRNVLVISGDPATREALLNLVHAFDVNVLAGQSYALFPVTSGNAKDFATAMSEAMRSTQGAALASAGARGADGADQLDPRRLEPAALHRRCAPGLRAGRAVAPADGA